MNIRRSTDHLNIITEPIRMDFGTLDLEKWLTNGTKLEIVSDNGNNVLKVEYVNWDGGTVTFLNDNTKYWNDYIYCFFRKYIVFCIAI